MSNCLIGKEVDGGRGWMGGGGGGRVHLVSITETAYENIRAFLRLHFISMFVPFTFALGVVRVGWCS